MGLVFPDTMTLQWNVRALNRIWILLQGKIRQALLVGNQIVCYSGCGFFCHLLWWRPGDLSSMCLLCAVVPSCVLCPCGFVPFCSFCSFCSGSLKGGVKNVCSVSLPVWKPAASVPHTVSCSLWVSCVQYFNKWNRVENTRSYVSHRVRLNIVSVEYAYVVCPG